MSVPTYAHTYDGKRRRRLIWRIVLFALLLSLLLSSILVIPFLPGEVGPDVRVGFPAPYDIKSPLTTRYVSQILTDVDREAAAEAVADVYRFDSSITLQKRQALSETLAMVEAILFAPELDWVERRQRIAALEGVDLSESSLSLLLALQEGEWEALREETMRLYDQATRDPADPEEIVQIQASELSLLRSTLSERVPPTFHPMKRELIAEIVSPFLVSNYTVDETETERRREEARARTPSHYVDVLEGELILLEGQIVRDVDLEKLEAVGLRSPTVSWPDFVGPPVLVVCLVISYSVFLFRFQIDLVRSSRKLILLGVVMVVTLLGAKFLVPGRVGLAYAFPLPAAPILLTLLLNPQVALGGTVVLSFLVALMGGCGLELAVLGIVGGLVGLLGIWKAQRSGAFLFTGFYITLANLAVIGAFHLIARDLAASVLLTAAIACAINGFSSVALSFATFGFLGTLFGQVTVLQLMELANPNHPLLRRLMQEAPGTYFHSIVLANLAERAAEVVGADPLLARVGAYYHDVGKLVRPYFFIDNQAGRSNIHEELPPRTSARLIIDHVCDGISLARKYRLPEQIVQFIPQHHGTSMATYFYRQALQEEEDVDPDDYRYPGPKPQSKETAILMLADSVEATVRSMDQSGALQELLESSEEEDPLEKLVGEIIDKRVRDEQLDECDLTFRDLNAIRSTFADILRGIYHRRVSYPELGQAKESAS